MAKPKVLLLGEIDHAKDTWAALSDIAELVEAQSKDRAEFIKHCKEGKYDGVVAAYRTFGSVSITGPWNEELVKALPESFKSVSHNGAGYDQLTIPPLTARSIIATHVPTAVDDATADTAIFLLLGALRNFNPFLNSLRASQWRGNPPDALGRDPGGKLLGVLGMGGIGRNFALKARALGMDIQYHNRRKLASADLEAGAKYVSFDELLATSDVISVHVPLNEHTRHLLSKAEFAKCKNGVVIVNTARGAVIDEAALVEALDSGHVKSAGLDVFEEEPKVHEGLIKNPNVILLPHSGTWTYDTQLEMEKYNIRNVRRAVEWRVLGNKESAKAMSIVHEQAEFAEKLLKE